MAEVNFKDKDFTNKYDDLANKVVPGYQISTELMVAHFEHELPDDAKILVVGCGTGDEIIELAKLQPKWEIIGIDLSEEMVNFAQEKVKHADLPNTITLITGDLTQLGFDTQFDAVVSKLVFIHIPSIDEKQRLFSAIYNLLKPNGLFAYVDYFKITDEKLFLLEKEVWTLRAIAKGVDPNFIYKALEEAQPRIALMSEDVILSLLKNVGFIDSYQFLKTNMLGGYIMRKSK